MSAGIFQDIADLFSFFDGVFTETDAEKIKNELKNANMEEIEPRRYLSFSLGASLLLSILILIFSFFFRGGFLFSAFLFFASFAILFFLIKNYSRVRARQIADEIESDLPVALRSIGVELNMNTPFEQALEHAADSNYGALSLEMRKTLREIRTSGMGVPEALRALGSRVESTLFRRAISQLLIAYEQGTKGEPIKKLADEMMDLQRARAREFSAKSAFFGLLLIAVSCILPAMFEVYLIVSSSFMRAPLSPLGIWLVYLVAFPAFNLIIILYLRSRTPRALRTQKSKFLSPDEMRALDEELHAMGIKQTMKTLLARLLAVSVFLAISVLFLLRANQMLAIPLSLVLLLSPVLAYAYVSYRLERRTREMERYLPDALFHAASMQKGVHIEKIISSIAGAGYGALSSEFELARKQIKGGASVPSALNAMRERNDSLLLDRALSLILQGYKTGADMYSALRETADDIFSLTGIVRERASALAIQKYTLLFAGGLLIPVILGVVVSMVSSMSAGVSDVEIFSKLSAAERAELMGASTSALQAYLLAYALLASVFVAHAEGEGRKFIIYFILLAPASLALFTIARSADLSVFW